MKTFIPLFFYVLCLLCFSLGAQATKTPGELFDSTLNDLHNARQIVKSSIAKLWKYFKDLNGRCTPCVQAKSPNVGCDCRNLEPKRDCLEFYQHGFQLNGIYRIQSERFTATTLAYCDQTTQGGGWTVILRRKDGSVDFNKSWKDYKNGFGKLDGEFWFGNDLIHYLTSNHSQLLINMKMKGAAKPVFAKYASFQVADEQDKYRMTVSGYSGTTKHDGLAGDLNGMKFSTKDQDNDKWGKNCASHNTGGWWYKACYMSHLTGKYGFRKGQQQIFWHVSAGHQPTFVEMKVRRNE